MKTIRSFCNVLLAMVVITMSACSNNDNTAEEPPLPDPLPFNFLFIVQDADGNDLLDAKMPGNVLSQPIKDIYNGKELPLDSMKDKWVPGSPVDITFSGLTLHEGGDSYYLEFGLFDSQKDYKNETFIIDWGDGSTTTVTFSRYYDRTPTGEKKDFHYEVLVNGKQKETDWIKIVK